MGECVFCKIVRKEIPAKICAESSKAVAFHDINPQAPVHILIIPKEHVESVLELEAGHAEMLQDLFMTARACAKEQGVEESGFRLVFNCGPDAGQAVDHLHLHLLGKRKLKWPPG